MDFNYTVVNDDGIKTNLSVVGFFRVPELDKEFVMYSIMDENPDNSMGSILIGEVIHLDDNTIKILDIKEDEIDLVLAFYNEISEQVGN